MELNFNNDFIVKIKIINLERLNIVNPFDILIKHIIINHIQIDEILTDKHKDESEKCLKKLFKLLGEISDLTTKNIECANDMLQLYFLLKIIKKYPSISNVKLIGSAIRQLHFSSNVNYYTQKYLLAEQKMYILDDINLTKIYIKNDTNYLQTSLNQIFNAAKKNHRQQSFCKYQNS